jgi:DNA-binding CsgD family transcriptional regulator
MKPLSPREHQVAEMYVQGRTQKEIARALCISRNTVYIYLKNAKEKTGCPTVISALVYLVMNGHVVINSA